MEFGEKLKKLRLEKGISQQKLADMIFVSRSAVAKWENGLGLPSTESYQALAEVFDVPSEFFQTECPEQVIVEKNRKIKKISLFLWIALIGVVLYVVLFSGRQTRNVLPLVAAILAVGLPVFAIWKNGTAHALKHPGLVSIGSFLFCGVGSLQELRIM